MKIAFSTTACPDWTLAQAIGKADEFGYLGLDMRSFHQLDENQDSTIASDPIGMDPSEIQEVFDEAGVTPISFSTSVKFDKMINPPVIGRVFFNEEEGVSDAKRYVDLADRAGVKFVRVYGNNLPAAEPKTWSMQRVCQRLKLAAQTGRNTEVRLLVENAGSFARVEELMQLVNAVDSQWLGVSYNILASVNAGGCPIEDVRVLKDHLLIIRVCDVDRDGRAVKLGEGVFPLEKFFAVLHEIGYEGWIVYDYPKVWDDSLTDPVEDVLKHAADTMYGWMQAQTAGC